MMTENLIRGGFMFRHFIGAAVAAACFGALPAQAQQIIKATDVHPLGYPTVEAIVRLGHQDLKGMKIRMMGNPLFVETMNAMGGNGIAMGFNELHQALNSGVVDGAENNEPTLFAQNHYQTPKGKVYSLTGHLIIPEIFVYSKVSWEKLPKADQDLIRKLSREAQLEQRVLWDAYVAEATAKLKAAGVKFLPADKEAFFKAIQPVRDKYGAKYAGLIERIRAIQ